MNQELGLKRENRHPGAGESIWSGNLSVDWIFLKLIAMAMLRILLMSYKSRYIVNVFIGSLEIRTRLESTGTIPGVWNLDFGLLLWTEDDSGLPTGPLTFTKTLKTFFYNVLLEHVGLIRVLPLVVHLFFFCTEQVDGVILSHISSLGFILRVLLHA